MSDSLLQLVAAGDASAMQRCIDTYSGLVWSLARKLSASPAEAEDGVQEVFIALWENASRFDPDKGAEVTFVAMMARRRLIDRGRGAERRDRLIAGKAGELPREPNVVEPATDTDEARQALDAMGELGAARREVLGLAIHHGCTHEQIASITGIPLGTVKTHARRGLMQIREILAGNPSGSSVEATS